MSDQRSHRVAFGIPDYWGLAEGVERLAVVHVLHQLDLAAIDWRMALAIEQRLNGRCPRARQRAKRLQQAQRLVAYRIVTQAEAWKQLCAELQLDPEEPLRHVPGYLSMRMVE